MRLYLEYTKYNINTDSGLVGKLYFKTAYKLIFVAFCCFSRPRIGTCRYIVVPREYRTDVYQSPTGTPGYILTYLTLTSGIMYEKKVV